MVAIKIDSATPELIAPCGINCRLCRAYAREKNHCPGCQGDDTLKSKSCVQCKIKNCEKLLNGELTYCYDCAEFPCERVSHLDKRYRTKYAASPIANLLTIKEFGVKYLVEMETLKWTCPQCGGILCMHQPQCLNCTYTWHN